MCGIGRGKHLQLWVVHCCCNEMSEGTCRFSAIIIWLRGLLTEQYCFFFLAYLWSLSGLFCSTPIFFNTQDLKRQNRLPNFNWSSKQYELTWFVKYWLISHRCQCIKPPHVTLRRPWPLTLTVNNESLSVIYLIGFTIAGNL